MMTLKSAEAVRAAFRIVARSWASEMLVLLPSVAMAGYWFGVQGITILGLAVCPLAFLSKARDRYKQQARPDYQLDEVTGLPPRQAIIAALDRVFDSVRLGGRKSACLVIRIDESHNVLENHGQIAHDKILQKTAERISCLLRDNDLIARLEGDRFALALAPAQRMDLEATIQIAVRLKTAIGEPLSIDGMKVYLSASVGFCLTSRAPQQNGAAILSAAELALEDARRSGPGAIRAFSPEVAQAAARREDLRFQIEAALDNGEIVAHFQPQLSTDTGEVTGFEALARWNHPTQGILTPAEFLPLVMGAGLSERLTEVMVVHSLAALRNWDRTGQAVPSVAVNYAQEELRNPTLVAKLKWELDRFDIAPDRLVIEVLESVVARADDDIVVHNICALSKMGCRIDLDDFGTGQASIANIRRFSVDRIKIDRSFVMNSDKDPSQQQVVSAILSMAERLGLETVAEGVESIGEHAILSQLGCTHVQGYVIARPMPFEETRDWLALHRNKLAATPRVNRRTG